MPALSGADVDGYGVVNGDSSIPFNKLLLLTVSSLEGLSRTERTLDVALVEVPRALIALASAELCEQT